jgi:hypothetical protein
MASPATSNDSGRKLDVPIQHDKHPEVVLTPTEARQGTGPRSMVTVLLVSLALAAIAGFSITYYFINANQSAQPPSPTNGVQAPVNPVPSSLPAK